MKTLFLFGHRQQHGKDTVCNIIEKLLKNKQISYHRTYFAKLLKKQVAEKYNLDFNLMENNDYKMSIVPNVDLKTIYFDTQNNCEVPFWVYMNSDKLNILMKTKQRTVRDILIEEGCFSRNIWQDVWAASAYFEITKSNADIGLISDYRFPNEYVCHAKYTNYKVIRVLIHRPGGIFKNDGADGELPDLEDKNSWDYVIINDCKGNNWEYQLETKVINLLKDYNVL